MGHIDIVFMYDKDGQAAERSYVISKVVKDIIVNHLYDVRIKTHYLEITRNEEIDKKNLWESYRKKYRLYVSSLGSTITKYLSEIFFNKFSKSNGVMHVNSFSTAASLSEYPNLLRIFPPDTINPPIFAKLVGDTKCYILYVETSIWGSGLAQSISSELQGTATLVPFVEDMSNLVSQFNNLVNKSTQNTTIIILSDHALKVSQILDEQTDIESRLTNFKLLYGDATADSDFESERTLKFVQRHNGVILQPHIDEDSLELEQQIQENVNDNEHRVSSQVSVFMDAITVATLLDNVCIYERNNRYRYANIVLNENLDNSQGLYSLNNFETMTTYGVAGFVYVAGGKIHIST
jgi:hypothetical protein